MNRETPVRFLTVAAQITCSLFDSLRGRLAEPTMTFLDPTTIALATGLTIPPLVALYFLKLKRATRLVPSTLLWKKAVEDLRVNAPFQRLRRSLLLLLQLLVLILAAIALGKPMFQAAETHEGTLILLIDQSASMAVMERGGRTRLDLAKEQADRAIDSMADDARAMIIAFCDRATVVSSFDSDKQALKRNIDSIEQTQSTTSLTEAVALAEAYAQNLIIGGESPGSDIAPISAAPAASVFLFTDGRIEDAGKTPFRQLDPAAMQVTTVGSRGDNVGILNMAARRNYEKPEMLEVTARIRNFGETQATVDAALYIDGRHVDMQTISLETARASGAGVGNEPGITDRALSGGVSDSDSGDVRLVAFDHIEFGGGGLVEVALKVDDALPADDRAWTFVEPPRHLRVLLVCPDDLFLENVLNTLDLDLAKMSPDVYEVAPDDQLNSDGRSLFDVVVLDRHSTKRLPRGNYLFWGGIPQIGGVSMGPAIRNQIIFDWDETHPVLRYVAVEAIDVLEWFDLKLPSDAKPIIEGETSPVLAYLTRDASQYLVSAFSLVVKDDHGIARLNTDWVAKLDFVVFMQNAVQFLSSNIATVGEKSVSPGTPVSLPIPANLDSVQIVRPDGATDMVPAARYQTIHYSLTRSVGPYRVDPGVSGQDIFAVNLFNAAESDVSPVRSLSVGAARIEPQTASVKVSKPAWNYFLIALLALLLLEWIVYNRRVMV